MAVFCLVQRLLGFSIFFFFSSHEPRSVNSRFDGSKRRKQGLCARAHTGCTVITCWSDFFYFSLSLVDHFYFLYCFVSGVENALSIANLQRTIFDSHCVGILFSTAIALLSISYASIFSSLFSHTKNHSSSFSAKKKRKKSVITFNFNSNHRSLSAQTNEKFGFTWSNFATLSLVPFTFVLDGGESLF